MTNEQILALAAEINADAKDARIPDDIDRLDLIKLGTAMKMLEKGCFSITTDNPESFAFMHPVAEEWGWTVQVVPRPPIRWLAEALGHREGHLNLLITAPG
jgi:hypothetical protein